MRSAQLSKAIAGGTAVRLLDVRTPEFENRHIAGACNVLPDQLAEQRLNRGAADKAALQ